MKSTERHTLVPTDLEHNIRFRLEILRRCEKDKRFRDQIMLACAQDPLFFFNVFCFVYEPRNRFTDDGLKLPKKIPFIAWKHQVPAIRKIYESLGDIDIGVEKSRGEGASWIGVLLAIHALLFHEMNAVGLVSKDENSADDPKDSDSLMWKCDFTLDQLPTWMAGQKGVDYTRDKTTHVIRNKNGSSIVAYAATGNVASGGRKSWFLMDELSKFPRPNDVAAMASTQHVTDSRLIVSTPLGNSGAYYDVMHEPSSMVKIVLDWKQNPTRNRGLYRLVDGIPVAVDPENNPLPPDYDPPTTEILERFSKLRRRGFKLERKDRSPWYDNECERPAATPQNIAQELDRDYGGSAYRVFGDSFFEKVRGHILSCVSEGELSFNDETVTDFRFDRKENGPLKLWVPLSSLGDPPPSMYAFGADISTGTGGTYTSNSSLIGIDLRTGEQACEFVTNSMMPIPFADTCVAIAKWFYGGYLAWEHNGPGAGFTKQVLLRQYEHIYYRMTQFRRGRKKSKEAGWWTDERTKEVMFAELQNGVLMNDVIFRSSDLLKECGQYVRKDGKITHALIKSAADDGKGASHGDRVIAAAVCVQAARDRPTGRDSYENQEGADPPIGTMAYREREYEDSLLEARANDGWVVAGDDNWS